MSVDQSLIETVISVVIAMFAPMIVLFSWLRSMLIKIFKMEVATLKAETKACQEKLTIKIDQIDKYGQANRKISYEAKDGIAEHVKDFHTK